MTNVSDDDLLWAALAAVVVLLWRFSARQRTRGHHQRAGMIITRLQRLHSPKKGADGTADGTCDEYLR